MAARKPDGPLRTGFTTGACATAATAGALEALLTGIPPNSVEIGLPRGERVSFVLERVTPGRDAAGHVVWAEAAVRKDAGDDPDVTHQALIVVRVSPGAPGAGVTFAAGEGVGLVTKPGLPIPPGEPAINPVPRAMMAGVVEQLVAAFGQANATPDYRITISVPGGAELAQQTWNPRLGIEGGISILGTTGIVRPFSCAAWIASIHRGIDVARANGAQHVIGSTGATSERIAQARFDVPDWAMLDMGDFAGGMLKYLKRHPLPRLTIAGGFGKLTKLAQGALDLHSGRSQVDFDQLDALARELSPDAPALIDCNTAAHALSMAGPELAALVARDARRTALATLGANTVATVDVLVVDRDGTPLAFANEVGATVLDKNA